MTTSLAEHGPGPDFDLVVDLQPDQDPAPWMGRGASWVLTRIGPFDLDLAEVRRIVEAGPGVGQSRELSHRRRVAS